LNQKQWSFVDEITPKERIISQDVLRVERFRERYLLNSEDKPRLNTAQGFFRRAENENEDGILEELYAYWRDLNEFLILRSQMTNPKTWASEWTYVGVKCSKRGNDVYSLRVKKRLDWLSSMENIQFFEPIDFSVDKKVFSSALWITLTWDTKRCSRFEAWEKEISSDFNRFMSALRSKYGEVSGFRTWEASEKGYPHCHVVLVFKEAKFTVFPYLSEDEAGKEKLTYRVAEKDQIASYWHSHVDVQAVSSTKKLFNYMRKYQTKTLLASDSPKGVQTMSLMWLFKKRGFSVSGDFRSRLSDLIRTMHNSNMEFGQSRLDGSFEDAKVWEFVGIFSGSELGIHSNKWTFHLNKAQISTVLEKEAQFSGSGRGGSFD
jgi:hypothetical protein